MTSRTFCSSGRLHLRLRAAGLGALALLVTSLVAAPASAQIAAAIGRPMPSASDATGTVIVRVSNGDRSAATGLDVTLMVGSSPRVSRTDAEGRATFAGVPAGAQAVAQISTEKGGSHQSQPFTMPPSGGVRLLMSTSGTFEGAGGGGDGAAPPMAGQGGAGMGGGAQPSLRERSGGIVANPGSSAKSLSIRLSYDDPADPTPPKDHPVYLVSYSSDEKIAVLHKNSDAEGRVVFDGLDVSGATAYFAMTLLPRGQTFDRLLSGPLLLPGGTGVAMVLSGEKRTSTAPGADDIFDIQRLPKEAPIGKMLVELQGAAEIGGKVVLRDAETGAQLAEGVVEAPPAEVPADSEKGPPSPQASIDTSALPIGKLVYAESSTSGQLYRSMPMQLVPDRGARAVLLIGPRVMMRFSVTSELGEDYFAFRGRFMLANNSWFPYKQSEDGLTMPLPVGFTGAQTTEEDAVDISPVPGEGLRILRPLPPGGKSFLAGWSMPTTGGVVTWDLALPWGSAGSGMEIMMMPGTTVELPPGVQGREANAGRLSFYVLPEISIRANQRMVMTIRGLPTPPTWKLWGPRIAGILVIVILVGGLAYAFGMGGRGVTAADPRQADKETRAKIDALMDELVALEGSSDEERRNEVMAQLEALWPTAQRPEGDRKAGDAAQAGA